MRYPGGRLISSPGAVAERRNGRIDSEQREAMETAITARQRIYSVPVSDAKDQRLGSVVGRMARQRIEDDGLSEVQYAAALRYIQDVNAYRQAIEAPSHPRAVDLNSIGGKSGITQEHIAFVARATERYNAMRRAITDEQVLHRNTANLLGALDVFCIRDAYVVTLVGDLRIALSCLARHYQFADRLERA